MKPRWGKGDRSGGTGNQEWTFRMHNRHDPLDTTPRPNRISFYLFKPQGRLGVGSYVQVAIHESYMDPRCRSRGQLPHVLLQEFSLAY